MFKDSLQIVKDRVETEFLARVRKPSRYIGGEVNQIQSDPQTARLRFALCFPDIYEIGMSHTGLAILYDILNRIPGVCAQRCFAPWSDAEAVLREKNIPLFTLESKAALGDFDVVGLSLTNEMCYAAMLNMLDLAGIPLRSADRTEAHPLVFVGGQAANCCEPIAPFVDCFLLGQAEEALPKVVEVLLELRETSAGRDEILRTLAGKFDFLYVPSLYRFEYDGDRMGGLVPLEAGLPVRFTDAFVDDLDAAPVPEKPIVPFTQAVHERVSIEVMRGCPGRCRFCQASYCRRPIRFRSVERVLDIARKAYAATGFDTVSLLSLSTADYPDLEELITRLHEYFEPLHVGVSLPSLKVQAQLRLLPRLLASVRKSGMTIAVEAASPHLREIIKKPITDEDLFAAARSAYEHGFGRIKLYFMVGFPGETEEDIERIVDLSLELACLRRETHGRPAEIAAAVSWLVPKPHTPFGMLGQRGRDYFARARELILARKRALNARCCSFKFHDINQSILEAALARADRRHADCIETAFKNGARLDLWSEHFDMTVWENAFAKHGFDLYALAQKQFAPEETLPWQHLGGPDKTYLQKEYADSQA